VRRLLYLTWREYGSELLLLALCGLIWFAFGLMTYGCAAAQSPDDCDAELAGITTACAVRLAECPDAQCVERVRDDCHEQKEQACK
jgi:hypothetical protein